MYSPAHTYTHAHTKPIHNTKKTRAVSFVGARPNGSCLLCAQGTEFDSKHQKTTIVSQILNWSTFLSKRPNKPPQKRTCELSAVLMRTRTSFSQLTFPASMFCWHTMSVCHIHAVAKVTRGGQCLPWNWSYRWLRAVRWLDGRTRTWVHWGSQCF